MFAIEVRCEHRPTLAAWDFISGTAYRYDSVGIDEGEENPPEGLDSLVAANEFMYALEPGLLNPPIDFTIYFSDHTCAQNCLDEIRPLLENLHAKYELQAVKDIDYTESWKTNFVPIEVFPNWLIRAPWHESQSILESRLELIIEPGMAFGTGSHETTKACLELISESFQPHANPESLHVLDFGCGTGILAIALKKMNVGNVYGVDIDPLSIEATCRNADRNDVVITTALSLEELALPALDGIVANILKNTLLEFKEFFYKSIKPGGILILSGLLDSQTPEITAQYEEIGFKLVNSLYREDDSQKDLPKDDLNKPFIWAALLFVRN